MVCNGIKAILIATFIFISGCATDTNVIYEDHEDGSISPVTPNLTDIEYEEVQYD